MPVGEPTQKRRNVLTVPAGEAALGVGVKFVRQTAHRRHHRTRIERHLARVGQYAGQQLLDLGERLAVHCLRELDVNPGLVGALARRTDIGERPQVEQFPGRSAAHPEHRVHDRGVRNAESVQQHRHRVHHHRGVVSDDLQCGAESPRIVCRVHRNAGVADGPVTAEPVVRGHQTRPHHEPRRHVDGHGHRRIGGGRVVRTAVSFEVRVRQPSDRLRAQRLLSWRTRSTGTRISWSSDGARIHRHSTLLACTRGPSVVGCRRRPEETTAVPWSADRH